MWSPHFVPRPKDWPEYVDIVGTIFSEPSTSIPSFPSSTSPSTPISTSFSVAQISPYLPLSNSHTNSPSSQYLGSNSCYNSRSGSKSSFFSHLNHNSKLDSSSSDHTKAPHTPIRQERSIDNDYSPPKELLAFFSSNINSTDLTPNLKSKLETKTKSNSNSDLESNNKFPLRTHLNEFQKSENIQENVNKINSEKTTESMEVSAHSKTPIFIGFGSMVIENPKELLQVLLQGEK